jgi:hypothetical protein
MHPVIGDRDQGDVIRQRKDLSIIRFLALCVCVLKSCGSASLKCGSGSKLHLMRMWIQLFTLMQIQIRIFMKVMGICDHWTVELPGLNFKPPLPSRPPL